MEKNNNINIAEILKDYPKGTKLYSTVFGEVTFDSIGIEEKYPIIVCKLDGMKTSFTEEGHYTEYPNSECVLFPSSKMRDWSKFFKRGDVVYSSSTNTLAIFEGWANSYYTDFKASIFRSSDGIWREGMICITGYFVKVDRNSHDEFIADAEEHYNGKYNPDTLQVEPVKPKFPFKPFDKVLVRDVDREKWRINLFSHFEYADSYCKYYCIGGFYLQCIPYKGNEHLLDTTLPYEKGGEK